MKWSKLLCLGMAAVLSCSIILQTPAYAQEAVQKRELQEESKEYAGSESLEEMVTGREEKRELPLENPMGERVLEVQEAEEKGLQVQEVVPEIVSEDNAKADNVTEGSYEYKELNDGAIEIVRYWGSATELVVPAEIDGKRVSKIGGVYEEDGEDYVGAFEGCRSLSSVKLPEGLTSIEWGAFRGCSSLSSIELPEGLTSIGWGAFNGCSSLTEINVHMNNTKYASQEGILYDKEKKTLVCCPEGKRGNIKLPEGVKSIGGNAFEGCSSLSSIELPEGLKSIKGEAFYECSSLSSIKLPERVMSIEWGAFSRCSSLSSIELPKGLKSVGEDAFSGCSSLKSIKLPEGVTSIEWGAFSGCSSLSSIKLPKGLTSIGSSAFYECSSLRSIKLPKGVKGIEYGAFEGCSSLTKINVDIDNLKYASQKGILYDKKKKTLICCPEGKTGNIKVPEGVTSIEWGAFSGCSSLSSIKLPKGLTSIGSSAFYECSSLRSIKLPKGVKSIGNYAFRYCSSLKRVIIPTSVTNITRRAFDDCSSDLTLYVVKDSYAESYAQENELKYSYFVPCAHTYQPKITKATTKKNGTHSEVCTKCGNIKSKTTIYAAKNITLSKTSYVYNGKVQKPSVSIKDSKGKTLTNKTDYTISYDKGRKNVGVYTVTIQFQGNYKGKVKKTFTIKPKSTSISKLTPKEKGFALEWKKQTKQTTGYEIAYSASNKFTKKSTKMITVKKNKTVSKSISKLKAKKKYYVKIRTYKNVKVRGTVTKIYSDWSKVKCVTTKNR